MDSSMISDETPMEYAQGNQYPHLVIPGNDAYNMPWTTSHSPYPSMGSASAVEFGPAWSYAASSTASTRDDPSIFSTTGSEWSNYESISTDGMWAPSVNTSSAMMPSCGGLSPGSAWGSSNHALSSPYSEVAPSMHRPSLTRSISADNGLAYGSTGLHPDFYSTKLPASAPTSPALEAGDAASATTPRSKGSKSSSKSSKKSDSKSRTNTSSSEKQSSKRKPSVSTSKPPKLNSAAAEQYYQAQLTARFGPKLSAMSAGNSPVTTDQIRREAWRICKAEALEMSQRRMKLLEHEHGALERETEQLQVNIRIMREAVEREHLGLEDAVSRAERMSSSY